MLPAPLCGRLKDNLGFVVFYIGRGPYFFHGRLEVKNSLGFSYHSCARVLPGAETPCKKTVVAACYLRPSAAVRGQILDWLFFT